MKRIALVFTILSILLTSCVKKEEQKTTPEPITKSEKMKLTTAESSKFGQMSEYQEIAIEPKAPPYALPLNLENIANFNAVDEKVQREQIGISRTIVKRLFAYTRALSPGCQNQPPW